MDFLKKMLHLNESKTEMIVFGPSGASGSSDCDLGDLVFYVKPSVKNLGVIFDSALQFDKQMNAVVKSSC